MLKEIVTQTKTYEIKDKKALEDKIYKLECKLSPEQMVIAFTKADKEAEALIVEAKEKAGWGNWLSSSVMNIMGYSSTESGGKKQDQSQEEEEMKSLMQKLKEFEASETSSIQLDSGIQQKQEHKRLSSHVTLAIPVIQLSLVNKSMHQFGSKQFMTVVVSDLFMQSLLAKKDNFSSSLVSIKNFEVIDRLLNQ